MADTEGLERALGVRALAASIVNVTIGSGIFVMPAVIAAILGPAAIVAFVACALGMGLIALCFAELGSRVSRTGGLYAYTEAAFGPFVGFLAGVLLWFGGDVISLAAISVVVVDSALVAVGVEVSALVRSVLIVVLLGSLAVANIRGVRTGVRLVEVATAAKLTPLAILIILGVLFGSSQNLVWHGAPATTDVARATLILVFAFSGTEAALTPSGEITSPARTIPRALLFGLTVITLTYIGVQIAAQALLGASLASEQQAPLAAAAGRAMASGRQLILAGTLISAFGYLTGNILSAPRMLFAFGTDGLLPRRFAAVHPRYRTPHVAIATHTALACAFALTGTFRALAVLSVVPTVLVFLGCSAATLVLRRRNVQSTDAPFRAPGGVVTPIAAAIFMLWLLTSAQLTEVIVVGAILVSASVLYFMRRRLSSGLDPARQSF